MYAKQTGGGMKIEDTLSSVEEDVLAIIKKVSVEGHEVPESTVTNFITNKQTITNDINEEPPNQVFEEMETQTRTEASTSTNISRKTGREMSPVVNLPQLQSQKKLPEKKTRDKNKLPKKLNNLINSAVAATTFESNLKQKVTLKQEYYVQKLAILTRIADAEERKADSSQKIATAIEANMGVVAQSPNFS